ncbi:MAG: prepilin-type N-terminal cleavage/methylation domain-containing protein [Candidatus Omnitrophota bacterium]
MLDLNYRYYRVKNKAFTLLEVLVIVIIIGILARLAFVNYSRVQENARDREAEAMLDLIKSAERMHQLETGSHVNCANTLACSQGLDLDLPSKDWNYTVTGASQTSFCTQADRVGSTKTACNDESTDFTLPGACSAGRCVAVSGS